MKKYTLPEAAVIFNDAPRISC